MRCTRCDRISFEELLARDRDGRLVFGWCADCIRECDCEIVEPTAAPIKSNERDPLMRRVRRLRRKLKQAIRRPRDDAARQRLAGLLVAGMMLAWAVILAVVGCIKIYAAPDGKGPWLLLGAVVMAIMSLSFWVAIVGSDGGLRFLLRVIHVAGLVAGVGILAWGIVGDRRDRTGYIVIAACSCVCLAWLVKAVERRLIPPASIRRTRQGAGAEDLAAGESTL